MEETLLIELTGAPTGMPDAWRRFAITLDEITAALRKVVEACQAAAKTIMAALAPLLEAWQRSLGPGPLRARYANEGEKLLACLVEPVAIVAEALGDWLIALWQRIRSTWRK